MKIPQSSDSPLSATVCTERSIIGQSQWEVGGIADHLAYPSCEKAISKPFYRRTSYSIAFVVVIGT